ncbi:MAG: MBL fold metallo-hydrolase [Pirellulaceae bacterium]
MKLVFLGTAGYHPSESRHTSCLMLPEVGVVLDAGSGMFRVRDRLATSTLDIFLSHAHLDHVWGVSFLFDTCHGKSMERVTLHAEAAKLAAIQTHLLAEELFPAQLPFTACPLAGPVSLSGGGQLMHFPLAHPGGSVGFRLDWPGRSMAYITDTTAAEDAAYIPHIRGVDLLVHECNFPDGSEEWAVKTGHSCLSSVLKLAKAAAVRRLVLTHIDPLAGGDDPLGLKTTRALSSDTVLARDLMEVEF